MAAAYCVALTTTGNTVLIYSDSNWPMFSFLPQGYPQAWYVTYFPLILKAPSKSLLEKFIAPSNKGS